MKIIINNLTEEQELAVKDFFANWQKLANSGISEWTAIYCDGETDFNPQITIDDEIPEPIERVNRKKCRNSIKIKVAPTRENGLSETIWIEDDAYMVDPLISINPNDNQTHLNDEKN